jgi:cobalt-zinc-cadmium efflux system membrane fusion protein
MRIPRINRLFRWKRLAWTVVLLLVLAAGVVAVLVWRPELPQTAASTLGIPLNFLNHQIPSDGRDHAEEADAGRDHKGHQHEGDSHREDDGHDHAGHEHGSGGQEKYDHKHSEAEALELSRQARANIGLQLTRVELGPFERTISVPGIVVEKPGWSVVEVTAPMTGVVTRVYPVQGESIRLGQPLFELRLTHEDLLQAQTEFLRTVEELDVLGRELARLERVTASGAIAGKTFLERKYEQQRQEAVLRSQRQALLLHGLSESQVQEIVNTRTLLKSLTVFAPPRENNDTSGTPEQLLQVRELKVAPGKFVNAGDTLCTLADHRELYLEGQAFEQDVKAINRVAAEDRRVTADLEGTTSEGGAVEGLKILYLDDKVDLQSRTFHFYVMLPNQLLREDKTPQGRRFVYWKFKPGQRTQIKVPVERWESRIVLPVEAVAQEGAESYVFEANDDHFDRRAVQVEYRDQDWVVIANDGALPLGSQVATSAAHQMQLAMKNKAGGGVDPHAGHNH